MARRIALISNSTFTMLNYRSGLVRRLAAEGHDVHGICRGEPGAQARFAALGARHWDWRLDPVRARPLHELASFAQLAQLLGRLDPDVVFSFTIKPNGYAGVLARTLRCRFVPTVTGLGTAFLGRGALPALARSLLRLGLERADHVFVQNPDDAAFLAAGLAVPPARLEVVPGSGLDLATFAGLAPPRLDSATPRRFCFVGRFLRQKGIAEFALAVRRLALDPAEAQFAAHGDEHAENRSVITAAELRALADSRLELRGWSEDPRELYSRCHFLVLPSHREGLSRTLVEAAACGVPAVTTDVPGCRDVVEEGVTGFLCRPHDPDSLAAALRRALALAPAAYARMSAAARAGAARFAEEAVHAAYLAWL